MLPDPFFVHRLGCRWKLVDVRGISIRTIHDINKMAGAEFTVPIHGREVGSTAASQGRNTDADICIFVDV